MHVAVTAEHIANGKRRTMSYCPIAFDDGEVVSPFEFDTECRPLYGSSQEGR